MKSLEKATSSASEDYLRHVQNLEAQIQDRLTWMKRMVWVRLGLALPGIALIVFGLAEKTSGSWTWKLGIALIFGFLIAATWHETNLWITGTLRQRLYGYRRLLARCQRDWANLLPLPTEECTKAYHSELSRDLDLFGDRSLFRWFSLAMTQSGATTICRWISEWANQTTIQERQGAVKALAAKREWRESFFATACNYQNTSSGPEGIVQWSQSPSYFAKRPWLLWITWFSPLTLILGFVTIIACKIYDYEPGQVAGLICILASAAINFLLTMAVIGPVHDIFVQIGSANRELQSLVTMIRAIQELDSNEPLLVQVREKCVDQTHSAETGLSRLQRIMGLAGMQRSPIMFLLYLILQVSFLWDIRVLELLESWKKTYGNKTAGWLEAIGMIEAINSAAAVADENPDWAFPIGTDQQVADFVRNPHVHQTSIDKPLLEVRQVSHPLLKDTIRVPNDVTIYRDKPLLLVTGSNMAGKSTLLRSIGVNSILSRLGAPVAATYWSGAPCELASSIRVQDSLQDGVSFFMAELKRLRSVVDTAHGENHPGGKQMMVLLDEILQGTNSRERQIAVEHVLDKLVEYGCIVLTSTHDLEMAGNDRIQRMAQVVHFREHFEKIDGKQVMRFDYVMHPGVTPTTNALKLLEMVGLRSESTQESS